MTHAQHSVGLSAAVFSNHLGAAFSYCLPSKIDGALAISSKWKALGGKFWMGDISPHPKTDKRVQDVTVSGIPLENAKQAIRMIRAKTKRIMSEAQKAALAKAQDLSPLRAQMQRRGLESLAEAGVMVTPTPEAKTQRHASVLRQNSRGTTI